MGLSNKSSVMAIMQETTEGVAVKPASGADFVALQDGFSFEPNFNSLENRELKASIGKAKTILGREQPKASFSHYLRHSGVEGQAPNYRMLLKAAFGTETVSTTQYNTAAASTTIVVKVGSGNGQYFKRGQLLLVKDGTNGFSMRPVKSVLGDDITLGFALANAPAAAIGLGKAIQYSPSNDNHPTLSVWDYRGNGGAIELVTGVRVTDFSWEFPAGEFINGSFSLEGVEFFYNPLIVGATTNKLDFLDESDTRVAIIPQTTYKDPSDLAQAMQDAMNSLGSASVFTVTYSNTTGKFTVTSDGAIFELLWDTGANTANSIGALIGANLAADQTAGITYTLTNAITLAAPFAPSFDSQSPIVAKDNELLIGGVTSTTKVKASKVSVRGGNSRKEIGDVTATSGVSGSVVSGREVTVSYTAILDRYDVDKFKRFRNGDETSFLYNFGTKSGGNWVAGKCGCVYIPTATISSFKLTDDEGLVTLEVELKAYVDDSGNGEVYLNFI